MTKEMEPDTRRMEKEKGSDQEQRGQRKFMVNVRKRCWWGISLWLESECNGHSNLCFLSLRRVLIDTPPPLYRTLAAYSGAGTGIIAPIELHEFVAPSFVDIKVRINCGSQG